MAEPTLQKNENAHKKEQVKTPGPGTQAAGLDNETAAAIAEVVPRAVADPGRLRPSEVLTLQRKTGNRAVVRLLSQVQPKLVVGTAFDPLEAEADRTADRVLSIAEVQPAKPTSPAPQGKMQREALEDDEEQIQAMSLKPAPVNIGRIQPLRLQRAAAEEEEVQTMRVQRAAAEEEEVQTMRVQRAAAEEEEVQTSRVQRAAEEEEEVQTMRVQRTAAEEEEVQTSRVQRAAEEEEDVQTMRVQRTAAEEEEVQTSRIQRAAAEEEEVQTMRVQRAAEEEDEIQTAREGKPFDPMDRFDPGSAVEDQIRSQAGGGEPLPGEIRSYMEPRFGADFSGVRIHTGSGAAKLNRQISARAFTFGKDIYLGEGSFAPASSDGRRLLAHELTHTIQQTGGVQRLTETAESLKKVSSGDAGYIEGLNILSDTWFDLIEAVEKFEKADESKDAAGKKAALNDIIKLSNKYSQARKTQETSPKDMEKVEAVQRLLNDALVEVGAINEEEGFNKRSKEDAESTKDKLASKGKDLLKNATQNKGAHTVEAVKGAQADLYGSVVERARNLNALLSVKGDSKAAERFEMIVEQLSGG
jgi:chemotaxis protein histidine kinase CheA